MLIISVLKSGIKALLDRHKFPHETSDFFGFKHAKKLRYKEECFTVFFFLESNPAIFQPRVFVSFRCPSAKVGQLMVMMGAVEQVQLFGQTINQMTQVRRLFLTHHFITICVKFFSTKEGCSFYI